MKILYQSPNYKPENVTEKYLYISLESGKPVIDETQKTTKTNYTIRKYELPESEYIRYSKCIAEAEDIKMKFPYHVILRED